MGNCPIGLTSPVPCVTLSLCHMPKEEPRHVLFFPAATEQRRQRHWSGRAVQIHRSFRPVSGPWTGLCDRSHHCDRVPQNLPRRFVQSLLCPDADYAYPYHHAGSYVYQERHCAVHGYGGRAVHRAFPYCCQRPAGYRLYVLGADDGHSAGCGAVPDRPDRGAVHFRADDRAFLCQAFFHQCLPAGGSL